MNTGVHDAVNLAWKLGGVLKGQYDESLLDSYEEERKSDAQRVIDSDKTASSLITGNIPEGMGKPGANPNELMQQFLDSISRFTIGLAIHYKPNILNQPANVGQIPSGHRGPDVMLRSPGTRSTIRLYQITKNIGSFYVLVFSGNPALTHKGLASLRHYLDHNSSFALALSEIANFITIIPADAAQADEHLGVKRFGRALYDTDQATTRYGFSPAAGGVVILRPDGIVGFSAQLHEGPEIRAYFERFIKAKYGGVSLIAYPLEIPPEAGLKEVEIETETRQP